MDGILQRLCIVEAAVSDIRSQVSATTAVLPHLATKADLSALKSEVHSVEASLVKWIVGTAIASAAVASAAASVVAKLVS